MSARTNPTLAEAIDRFESWLRDERGLADRTRLAYLTDLRQAEDYLTAQGAQKLQVARLEPLDLKDFLAYLRDEKGFKPRSLSRVMSSLRVFCRFAVQMEWLEKNPAEGLRNPKTPEKIPVFLTGEEAQRLLRTPDRADAEGLRDFALLVTFLYTGMRLSEVVGLNVEDVDYESGSILVRGKGSRERLLPLHGAVAEALQGYLAASQSRLSPGGGREDSGRPLFVDQEGKRMTSRMVGYAIQRCVRAAGLSHRITPHKLRHTFATTLLHRGADLIEIKELLGHSQLSTTSIYTHTTVERLRKAVDGLEA